MSDWIQVPVDTGGDVTMCFGCGRNNPIGLKLSFHQDGKTVRGQFTPGPNYQGWPGVVHGGIVDLILDEAMSYTAYLQGIRTVTARMQVRLKRPALVGENMVITAHVTRQNRRLIESRGSITLDDGTPVAEGSATLFIVSQGQAVDQPVKED